MLTGWGRWATLIVGKRVVVRSELVFTHFTCNQNCTYCSVRRASDDRATIGGDAVRERIRAALAKGAREIVLTGGEPGMRRDLVDLVRFAREAGAEAVGLETNATLLDLEAARALREAGLSFVRVNLSGWGEAHDLITRDPGGFARTLAGLRALVAAGLDVGIVSVVVRSTLELLPALPERLAEATADVGRLSGITVRVPTSSPDPSELVSYEAAVPVLVALDESSRKAGLPVKLAPDSGPPPCVFPHAGRIAHLYALTPGARPRDDHTKAAACAGCQMDDRCSGLPSAYLARFPLPTLRPITEDRVRRRLALISTVEEQVLRELAQPNRFANPDTGEVIEEELIRVNFHCNQACRFCFVSTHLPPAGDDLIRDVILRAAQAGKQVTLTGGEPTLNARLVEYVRLARDHGPHRVSLQTNAIRLADAALTASLVEAGMGSVQASLHGSYAELCDSMTEAPGTFDKQVLGIDNLHAHADVHLTINFVITQGNYTDLPAFVRFCAERWPRAFLNISFVGASSDVVPKEKALVPAYADVLPFLLEAIDEARARSMDIGGFESMCGIPLCLVPESSRPLFAADIPDGYDGGEFVKPDACRGCALTRKCFGMRRGYFDLYGGHELHAVAAHADAV